MENFQSLGLPEALLDRLASIQYSTPTPIQSQTIPHALQGLDVLGTAQTGTGKTAAYVIPLVCHLLSSKDNTALILTPTREIATQVTTFLDKILDRKSGLRTALIIGGDSMGNQLNQLRMKPRIIIGTPGRINDHLERGTLDLSKTSFMVLDETDRMLDMGFSIQLEQIFKFLPHKRQTLMFSATLPQNILRISAQYLKEPVRVSIGSTIAAADTITQEVIHTSEVEKYDVLLEQLVLKTGSVIIFVKTKFGTEKLAKRLREHGHSVDAIHGDLRQRNREKVMRAFRSKKSRILVATDIAARGLDIAHIECVINHDLPQCEEDFIHRIGRTGRAGLEGVAISLITPQDNLKWRNINKMMNPDMKFDSDISDSKSKRNGRSRGPANRSSDGANRFGRDARRPSGDANRSSEGANRFGRDARRPSGDANRSSEGVNRFGGDARRPSGDANRFGGDARRPSGDANRFGRDDRRPSGDVNRFGGDARRPSGDANRFGGDARRPSGDANRFGGDSRRPSGDANRFGGDSRRPSGDANRFGGDSRRPSGDANRFGGDARRPSGDANRSGDNANRFGRDARRPSGDANRSSEGANRFGRDSRKLGGDMSRPSRPAGNGANRFGKTSSKPRFAS